MLARNTFSAKVRACRVDTKGRCRVLRELATTWGHFVTRAEYDANPACRDFAFDAYPWK